MQSFQIDVKFITIHYLIVFGLEHNSFTHDFV